MIKDTVIFNATQADGKRATIVTFPSSQWKINFRQIPLIFRSTIATFQALLNTVDGDDKWREGEARR